MANGDTPTTDEPLDEGAVRGTLVGRDIVVPPVNTWRSSALRAMRQGDWETWAERTLSADAYEVWTEVDPTVGQISEFLDTISEPLGIGVGKSRASSSS